MVNFQQVVYENGIGREGHYWRSSVCDLCFLEDENLEHLFCLCSFFNILWNKFCLWTGIDSLALGGTLLDRLLSLNSSSYFWFFGLVFCWSIKVVFLQSLRCWVLWRHYLEIELLFFIKEGEIFFGLIGVRYVLGVVVLEFLVFFWLSRVLGWLLCFPFGFWVV